MHRHELDNSLDSEASGPGHLAIAEDLCTRLPCEMSKAAYTFTQIGPTVTSQLIKIYQVFLLFYMVL